MKSFQEKAENAQNCKSELLATYRASEFHQPDFSHDTIAILDIH
jgi:hypothetical protein